MWVWSILGTSRILTLDMYTASITSWIHSPMKNYNLWRIAFGDAFCSWPQEGVYNRISARQLPWILSSTKGITLSASTARLSRRNIYMNLWCLAFSAWCGWILISLNSGWKISVAWRLMWPTLIQFCQILLWPTVIGLLRVVAIRLWWQHCWIVVAIKLDVLVSSLNKNKRNGWLLHSEWKIIWIP